MVLGRLPTVLRPKGERREESREEKSRKNSRESVFRETESHRGYEANFYLVILIANVEIYRKKSPAIRILRLTFNVYYNL